MSKIFGVTLFVVLCLLASGRLSYSNEIMKVHFIDVGYGDAVLIECPEGKVVLIDSGPTQYANKVISYLHSLKIDTIHKMILTHPHRDHFGGLNALFKAFSVGDFYYNGDTLHVHEGYWETIENIKAQGYEPQLIKKGDRFFLFNDHISWEVLNPETLKEKANNNAIVSLLTFKNVSFLFSSDIEEAQQHELNPLWEKLPSVDVVQIPHHGGHLAPCFIEKFREKIFIISTGPNDYGLPQEKALEKIIGTVLRTDQQGTIILESDGETIEIIHE